MAQETDLTPEARRLLAALAALPAPASFLVRTMPGEVAVSLGIRPGRAWRLFRDFWARGWYEYDISVYSGQLTPAGREAAAGLPVAKIR